MSAIEAAIRWYLVLAACSWAFAPFVRWLCRALCDRGATITRPIAILGAVYPAWLLASLGVTRFGTPIVTATLLLAAAVGWLLAWGRGDLARDWLAGLLRVELSSLALFAAYLWLRGYTPQILGTEKPMDVAFLASSMRTATMPPPDPWFAGEPINYYYLGYLLYGTVGRLADVPPATGFNLALATIFSMTAVAAFGVVANAIRPWLGDRLALVSGLFAAFMMAFSGNLYAPWRLLQSGQETLGAWWWDSAVGIGWRSSRIVCDGPRVGNLCQPPSTETINEFPFFSFLLGDLHPHLMTLPFTLVAIGLAWNLGCRATTHEGRSSRAWWPRVVVAGVIVGALYPLNAWDLPTFMMVAALAVLVFWPRDPRQAATMVAVLGAAGFLAWLPFYVTYVPPTALSEHLSPWLDRVPVLPGLLAAIAIHTGERTSLGEYLTIFGVGYAAGLATVTLGVVRELRAVETPPLAKWLSAPIGMIVLGVLLSAPVIPLCGIPLIFAAGQLVQTRPPAPRGFALAAFSVAWVLSILVEIVYIRDVFDNRMNTLFKFYYQTWTFYVVGAAAALAILWSAARETRARRALLIITSAAAVVAGTTYPVVASYQWTEGFARWQGLDGLAYGEEADADDVAAIRWLQEHGSPGDVALEAAGCAYRPFGRLPFNRVSAFTGIPTIIGWGDNHQRQWRAGQPDAIAQIPRRQEDVAAMYADPASSLFADYDVRWLFVGTYEAGEWRAECPAAGRYPGLDAPGYPGPRWREAFRSGQTRIYERLPR